MTLRTTNFGPGLGRVVASCALLLFLSPIVGMASPAENSPILEIDRGVYEIVRRDDATQNNPSVQAHRSSAPSNSTYDRMVTSTSQICARPKMNIGIEIKMSPESKKQFVWLEATCIYPNPAGNNAGFLRFAWADAVDTHHTHFFGCRVDSHDRSGTWHVKLDYQGRTVVDQSFDVDMHCGVPIS